MDKEGKAIDFMPLHFEMNMLALYLEMNEDDQSDAGYLEAHIKEAITEGGICGKLGRKGKMNWKTGGCLYEGD